MIIGVKSLSIETLRGKMMEDITYVNNQTIVAIIISQICDFLWKRKQYQKYEIILSKDVFAVQSTHNLFKINDAFDNL